MVNAVCRVLVRFVGLADVALAATILEHAASRPVATVLFAWMLLSFGACLALFVEAVIA